jgi:hypothetical protein
LSANRPRGAGAQSCRGRCRSPKTGTTQRKAACARIAWGRCCEVQRGRLRPDDRMDVDTSLLRPRAGVSCPAGSGTLGWKHV